nr:CYC02 protein-like [Coffea arabica]
MASSKNLLFLFGVLFALVLLISSDVTTADQETTKATGVHDASSGEAHQYPVAGYVCAFGCCRILGRYCFRCCPPAEKTPNVEFGDEVKN